MINRTVVCKVGKVDRWVSDAVALGHSQPMVLMRQLRPLPYLTLPLRYLLCFFSLSIQIWRLYLRILVVVLIARMGWIRFREKRTPCPTQKVLEEKETLYIYT